MGSCKIFYDFDYKNNKHEDAGSAPITCVLDDPLRVSTSLLVYYHPVRTEGTQTQVNNAAPSAHARRGYPGPTPLVYCLGRGA
jgi:hypothetical protein